MGQSLIGPLLLQLILILSNAFFACAEIAVISVNDSKLEQLALQGDRRAQALSGLTRQPARFLATIQVAITLSGFLGSAFAADTFSDPLVDWLIGLGVGIPASTLNAVAVVVITLILSYFTLVFGELVPKRLAMKKAETLALAMAGVLCLLARAAAPLVWVLTVSTNAVLRLCGIDPSAEEEEVSEEEIRMMVDIGSQKGVIDGEEREMIQNVFEFDDITVGAFATHRTELALLFLDDSPDEWEQVIHETRFSRYPVCGETVDQIVGILDAKDYFRLGTHDRDTVLQRAVRPAYFVPESLPADQLFGQMKRTGNHFAVVLDEYGGVMGIVTMSDLLEQLVGDLGDEIPEPPEIEPAGDGCWSIRGGAPLDEVARTLGVSLPVEDYDTFGGFVLGRYGFVPEDGGRFSLEAAGLRIDVKNIREHRVEWADVRLADEAGARGA
ncbi:MAG: HlyC/CorC family transporter [Oscillospiraceae bacterium]|nr:MAG: HlyC/CorC family transporter [Oscillospiraceae bacterium]